MSLKSPSRENIERPSRLTRQPSTADSHSFDYQKLLRQSSVGKSKRKKSLLVVSPEKEQVPVPHKDTLFDQIVDEYNETEDISRFKELLSRPKEIQQYVELLPSIFSFIHLSIIPEKKYFSENRLEIIKYCLSRLIDYYNVSLSFVNTEQDVNDNPIIIYFHDLLDIGNYLVEWLLLSQEDDDTFMEFLQLENEQELQLLQQKVHALLYYLCGVSFKYLNKFSLLGYFKTQKLFRLFLSWLTLAPFDVEEMIVSYPADRLIDVIIEFPDILYENIWTVLTTYDQLIEFYFPKLQKSDSKVFESIFDLLSTIYEECFVDIHERINSIFNLAISNENFDLTRVLLTKVAYKDPTVITGHPLGKELLCVYEFNYEGDNEGWVKREDILTMEKLNQLLSPSPVPFQDHFQTPSTLNTSQQREITPLTPTPPTTSHKSDNPLSSDYISPSNESTSEKNPVAGGVGGGLISLFPPVSPEDNQNNNNTATPGSAAPRQRLSFSAATEDEKEKLNKENSSNYYSNGPDTVSTENSSHNSFMNNSEKTSSTVGGDVRRKSLQHPQSSNISTPQKRVSRGNSSHLSPMPTPGSPYTKNGPVVFASYLLKVGSFFPSVKRRWFSLTDDQVIRYWRDATCKELKGSLNIKNIKEVTKLERDNWFEWKTDGNIHKGGFRLHCESPELYLAWNEHLINLGVAISHHKPLGNGNNNNVSGLSSNSSSTKENRKKN
jgi:hypothetical protein